MTTLTKDNYRSFRFDLETIAQINSASRFFHVTKVTNRTTSKVITEEYMLPTEFTVEDAHDHLLCEVIEVREHESIDAAVRYASGEVTRSLL